MIHPISRYNPSLSLGSPMPYPGAVGGIGVLVLGSLAAWIIYEQYNESKGTTKRKEIQKAASSDLDNRISKLNKTNVADVNHFLTSGAEGAESFLEEYSSRKAIAAKYPNLTEEQAKKMAKRKHAGKREPADKAKFIRGKQIANSIYNKFGLYSYDPIKASIKRVWGK